MNRETTRLRLRGVRAVLASRRDRAGAADVSYRVYIAVMLTIIVVAPAVRAVVLGLADALPKAQAAQAAGSAFVAAPAGLAWPGAADWLAAGLIALAALSVLAGAHTGPAHATLPQLDILFASPLPRARLLAPAAARVLASGAGVGAACGAVLAAARLLRDELDAPLAVSLMAGGAGLGVLVPAAMLIGQRGRRRRSWVAGVVASCAVLRLAGGIAVDPWSGYASVVLSSAGESGPRTGAELLGALPMLLLALVALVASPRLLASLGIETLRAQSANWDAIGVAAMTGDPRTALARLGAPVRVGRRIRWRPPPRIGLAVVERDLLGLLRAPARSIAGVVALLAAGALHGIGIAQAVNGAGWIAAVLGGAAGLASYLAFEPLARGLRAAAETVGAASLLPLSPGALLRRHAIVPGTVGAACLCTATTLGAGMQSPEDWGRGLFAGAMLAAAGLALRALAALKGPLPQRLLAPVPTPVGDMAGVNVLLWTLDGAINAVLVGALLSASWMWGSSHLAAVVASLVVVAGLVGWTRGRLASASEP